MKTKLLLLILPVFLTSCLNQPSHGKNTPKNSSSNTTSDSLPVSTSSDPINLRDSLRLLSFEQKQNPVRRANSLSDDTVVIDEDEKLGLIAVVKNDYRYSFIDLVVSFSALDQTVVYNEGNGAYQCASTTVLEDNMWVTKITFDYDVPDANGFVEIKELNFLTTSQDKTSSYIPNDFKTKIVYHKHNYGTPNIISEQSEYQGGEATKTCISCGHIKHYITNPLCDDFIDSFTYVLNESESGYLIKKYVGQSATPIVPDYYLDKPVIGFNDKAFENCSHIERIVLPHTINTIQKGLFNSCSLLTQIKYFGSSVEWNNLVSDYWAHDFLPSCVSVQVYTTDTIIVYRPADSKTAYSVLELFNSPYSTIATVNGNNPLSVASTTYLDYSNYLLLQTKYLINMSGTIYEVNIEWNFDDKDNAIRRIYERDNNTEIVKFNYSDTTEYDLQLTAKISYGEFFILKEHFLHLNKRTIDIADLSLADIYKVNDAEGVGFDLVDPETGYFKPNSSSSPYLCAKVKGEVIYVAPDQNYFLLGDGELAIEVFWGSSPIDFVSAVDVAVGNTIYVVGEPWSYYGQVMLQYIMDTGEADSSEIEPIDIYQPMAATSIIGKHYWEDGLQNKIVEISGEYQGGSANPSLANQRFKFDIVADGQTITVAYDYHTDKNGDVGLYSAIVACLKAGNACEVTVRGFLIFNGSAAKGFIGNEEITTWSITPFLADHFAIK